VRGLFKSAHLKWSDAMRDQAKAIAKAARQYDSLNTALATARSDRASFAGSVGSSLSGELFGNGLAGFQAAADANTSDANAATGALAAAIANGLDGPLRDALAASGDLNAITQFGALNAGQIAQEEQRYAAMSSAESGFGNTAAAAKYDASIATYVAEVKHLGKVIERLEKRLPDAVERASERGTHSGAHSGTAQGIKAGNGNVALDEKTHRRGGRNR
jgi:hypothetical protein